MVLPSISIPKNGLVAIGTAEDDGGNSVPVEYASYLLENKDEC